MSVSVSVSIECGCGHAWGRLRQRQKQKQKQKQNENEKQKQNENENEKQKEREDQNEKETGTSRILSQADRMEKVVIFSFMKRTTLWGLLISAAALHTPVAYTQQKSHSDYVNCFIGTQKMGHTFPGATAPFGMVQLSPETNQVPMFSDGKYNPKVYEYCAGYQYADSMIAGFSHTHFSGTGHSDLGDVLMMPGTGELKLNPFDSEGKPGYASAFSHSEEKASPGYYQVRLQDEDILAEMTASERSGVQRYTFPEGSEPWMMLDMTANIYNFEGKNIWTFLRVEDDHTITGYRQTSGWARTRFVYFAIRFDRPISDYGYENEHPLPYNGFYRKFDEKHHFPEMAGSAIKAWFRFASAGQLTVKVALSSVSSENALLNLETEVGKRSFNEVLKETQQKWEKELSVITVESLNEDDKTLFYTSLYHTLLSPVIYEDVNGEYRGLDQNSHVSEGFTNYTVFSMWDTYRALHPLFNLIEPQRNRDMIESMLAHQEQSVHHMLPVWSHYANENWCMIGYHSVSVLADAYVKGVYTDQLRMLQACRQTSNVDYYDGIGAYKQFGYIPYEDQDNSVSKTLEFAYDDWCIAQIAKGIQVSNLALIEQEYLERSEAWRALYDSTSGFMRPKGENGAFRKDFDPMDTHGQGFIEGNAWNYSLYVPQNIPAMIRTFGGPKVFETYLDSLFTMRVDPKYIEKNEDITVDGMIGNYVHGNEPSHHVPYLFLYAGKPEKTQYWVRYILRHMYLNKPDGLCGNDDAGQMSAWYIFSSLGFYPVTPGSEYYALGSPLVVRADIQLENGKTLKVRTKNQSDKHIHPKRILWNGDEVTDFRISHHRLAEGGTLEFIF